MRMRMSPVVLGLLALALAAPAQNPPPPPAQKPPAGQEKKPAKKAKKVWTEDDIGSVRKPWDEHSEQKEKEKEKEKAKAEEAKAAEEVAAGEAKPAAEGDAEAKPDENSPEGIEKQIGIWEVEKKRAEDKAEEMRKLMNENYNDRDRWESAKLKFETYEANALEYQRRIDELKAKLEEAKKKPGAAAAPAPEKP